MYKYLAHSDAMLLLLMLAFFVRLVVLPVLIKEKHLMLKQTITSHFVCVTFEFSLLLLNNQIHTRHFPLRYVPLDFKNESTLSNQLFPSRFSLSAYFYISFSHDFSIILMLFFSLSHSICICTIWF